MSRFKLPKHCVIPSVLLVLTAGLSSSPRADDSRGFNFTYAGGERPWLSHVPSEINTTFEEAVTSDHYLATLICHRDSTDLDKRPFHRVEPICLEGHGAKMVVPLGYPTGKSLVFLSPEDGGLFEKKHATEEWPGDFYGQSGVSRTKYFLVPFADYEIPTFYVVQTQVYLPIWRRAFQTVNQIDSAYFDSHIHVMYATLRVYDFEGKRHRRFDIEYYFYVDWARVRMSDSFQLEPHRDETAASPDTGAFADFLQVLERRLIDEPQGMQERISKIEPIDSIVSKKKVADVVAGASPLLWFDVNLHLRRNDFDGHLYLEVWGTIDRGANKCLHASVKLKDGSISNVQTTPCWVR